jgi:hypothetical protein
MTIGAPATADSLISVGAHVTKTTWFSPNPREPMSSSPAEALNALERSRGSARAAMARSSRT